MKPTQPSPSIRVATPADAAALAMLARQLIEYERALNETAGELNPWAASEVEIRKQMLRPGTRFFIAELDGRIVAYQKAMIHGLHLERSDLGTLRWLKDVFEQMARRLFDFLMRRPRPHTQIQTGFLAGSFVLPEARRGGLGKLLSAAAENWFRSHGLNTCEVHMLYANEATRRYRESLGYEPLALVMRKKL